MHLLGESKKQRERKGCKKQEKWATKVIEKSHKIAENRRIEQRGGKFCFFGISKCNPGNRQKSEQKKAKGLIIESGYGANYAPGFRIISTSGTNDIPRISRIS